MEVVHDVGVVVDVRAEGHVAILAQIHENERRKPAKQEQHGDDGTHDNDTNVAPSVVALLSFVTCRLFHRRCQLYVDVILPFTTNDSHDDGSVGEDKNGGRQNGKHGEHVDEIVIFVKDRAVSSLVYLCDEREH